MAVRSAVAVLGLCASVAAGDNYAVLVAGSSTYGNYRHQADIAHAYQVLVKGGIAADNIITMMYNDVVSSSENPFRGKLYNRPAESGGWDVYEGLKLDYVGEQVTAEAFMGVLTGNKSRTGGRKVLSSTAQDKVFVNFADHGGVGLVAFPSGPYLTASELIDTLRTMHTQQMYSELVFYMEACESGSMFESLPSGIGIYAVTAANAAESSWGTYCPPNDKVNGKDMETCLGDLFSVNWMQNADSTYLRQETLQRQYDAVKSLTTKSHVMQFGQLSIAREPSSNFEGRGHNASDVVAPQQQAASGGDASSRDVQLVLLHHRYLRAKGAQRTAAANALIAEIEAREAADTLFGELRRAAVAEPVYTVEQRHAGCYKAAHETVRVRCGGYTDYSLQYAKDVKALCDGTSGATSRVVDIISRVCAARRV